MILPLIMSGCFESQEIDQACMGIEPDDVDRIGDEVREGIDVGFTPSMVHYCPLFKNSTSVVG